MKRLFLLVVLATMTVFAAADTDEAQCQVSVAQQQQQACCKANKGICGCRAGKIVCCDKTFAEGCPCNQEDEPPIS